MRTYYQRHFLGAELVVCIILTGVLVAWIEVGHGRHVVDAWLDADRGAFYGAVAAVDGALLGFVIATATIVLGFAPTDRFEVLRGSVHYKTLWRVFTSTIRALGLATLATLAALLVDRDSAHNAPAMIVFAGFQLLAIVRVARAVWVLENVIHVVTTPVQDQ
jgi:hypothetical protein